MTVWYSGPWPDEDRAAAQAGLDAAAIRLAEISGLAPDEALGRLVGDLTLIANPYLQGEWHALVVNGVPDEVQFKPGLVTPELVVHEVLGHIVNDKVPNDVRPATLLARRPIVTASGKFVTGPGATDYSRHGGRHAPKNGYKQDGEPYQRHPIWLKDGNSALEDWADMVTSWVYDNLTDDERGQAIRSWVVDYLLKRLGL